jgi:hypothetical protein
VPVARRATVTIGTAALAVSSCAGPHQGWIVKGFRRLVGCVTRNRCLAHLYARPVDDIGV